jgi:hypothetical protein
MWQSIKKGPWLDVGIQMDTILLRTIVDNDTFWIDKIWTLSISLVGCYRIVMPVLVGKGWERMPLGHMGSPEHHESLYLQPSETWCLCWLTGYMSMVFCLRPFSPFSPFSPVFGGVPGLPQAYQVRPCGSVCCFIDLSTVVYSPSNSQNSPKKPSQRCGTNSAFWLGSPDLAASGSTLRPELHNLSMKRGMHSSGGRGKQQAGWPPYGLLEANPCRFYGGFFMLKSSN